MNWNDIPVGNETETGNLFAFFLQCIYNSLPNQLSSLVNNDDDEATQGTIT